MFTKKFVKHSFTFKFHVKVWSCNHLLMKLTNLSDLSKTLSCILS